MKRLKVCLKLLVLAVIGGAIYVGIEMLWRGHSHPSMFILGGLCFVSIGLINRALPVGIRNRVASLNRRNNGDLP